MASPNSAAGAADAAETAAEARDEILVTAHRQHGAVATSVPPEVSLNSTAIRALGAADLDEVFEDLAPEIGTAAGQPDGAAGAPVVLVNGQRIAGFSSIRDLPPETIRRIEIFPEKVALQYGYGPDQRVVNVVLRSSYRAFTVLARYTAAPDNWRGIYRGKADLVRIDENSHWNLDLDYRHEDPIFAGSTLAAPSAATDSHVPRHTLASQEDDLTVSGDATRTLGELTAELTGRLELDALQSRPGLSNEDGVLLAQEGRPDLATGPLARTDRTIHAQTSLTLNGKLDTWRWSFVGGLDAMTRVIRTGDAAGAGRLDTILLASPALLGHRCGPGATVDCVSTSTRAATGDLYLNGDVFALPAGAVTAALRTGFAFSRIRADAPLAGQATDRNRDEGSVQANLDFPLASRDSPLGKLSTDISGAARRVADFGTLATMDSTLEWSPIRPVDVLASFSRDEQAPSLFQLDEATLATPDLREYDFVTGDTAIVRRIEGGDGDLQRQLSRIAKLRLQVSPVRFPNLALSAEYRIERVRDPILSLTAATAAAMAAFPDRFARDGQANLVAIDVSPVNLARRDRQQVRWGVNYSTAFGAPRLAAGKAAPGTAATPVRNQFQIALYHTWRFQDDVVLRGGLPSLDLLGGDIVSDTGGTPRHEIELQTSVATGAFSANVNADWQSRTTANAMAPSNDRLTFSQGIRLDLRLQINLADQRWLTRRLPWLRGNLNLSADNLLGAHATVHDAGGIVPLAYRESYLNPTGRTFRITFRKRFR